VSAAIVVTILIEFYLQVPAIIVTAIVEADTATTDSD